MIRFVVVSVVGGLLFGTLDGLIHANPYSQKLYEVYKPISKTSVNIPAGVIIDLFYGFVMAGIFVLLYKSLPGETGIIKGISYAIFIWFFRVLMSVASQWMMYQVPSTALIYTLIAGFCEMLILGILYGLTLKF